MTGASLNSPTPSTTALPSVFKILTNTAGATTLFSDELLANNLSWLNCWFLQTAGPGTVTVEVQFADGVAVGGAPDWQPLVSPFGLVLGTPSGPLNYHLGCRRYRVKFTLSANATVRYHVTASI
jgi:hypothetical protein